VASNSDKLSLASPHPPFRAAPFVDAGISRVASQLSVTFSELFLESPVPESLSEAESHGLPVKLCSDRGVVRDDEPRRTDVSPSERTVLTVTEGGGGGGGRYERALKIVSKGDPVFTFQCTRQYLPSVIFVSPDRRGLNEEGVRALSSTRPAAKGSGVGRAGGSAVRQFVADKKGAEIECKRSNTIKWLD